MIEVCQDAFLFKDGLKLDEQRRLVSWYKSASEDFYTPRLKSGHPMSIKMTCLGHHWSAKDYNYYSHRIDADNKEVKPIEPFIVELAKMFADACFGESDFDICICNDYNLTSRLGMHVDNSETQDSLRGKPIVSFSVGASCIFTFGGFNRRDSGLDIRLDSGDVFVFGGASRLRYHGVSKILATDNPFSDDLNGGRLNFTLRKL